MRFISMVSLSIGLIIAVGCSTTDQEELQDQIDDWRGKVSAEEAPATDPAPVPAPEPAPPVTLYETDGLLAGAEWWCKRAGSVDECAADFEVVGRLSVTDRNGSVVRFSVDPAPAGVKWGVLGIMKWTRLDSGAWGFRGGGVDGTGTSSSGAKTIKNNGIQYRHAPRRSRSEVQVYDGDYYALIWLDGQTGRRSALSQVFRWPDITPIDPSTLPGRSSP